ncbi:MULTISPECIES: glutamate racemase [unclassified Acinetobacter]|uniref:glutamate racemase n=1 Tax=unclassified Acinetobacter TaxID=196816 RepID=UPI00190E46ED|nr:MULTISPECIES: glutamate racemase [unclassified Acinetobacter]MBK0062775.1 glutamate racemase [Acinetobacter sp. S55]MBK0065648.1 glutamate racemase [Acinetobacter sp. S54]
MTAIQPIYSELDPRPKASKDAPIGIFDSGVGGLTIAQEIVQHLPNEQIIYFADTAHVPYGSRSDQEIRQLTAQAIEWLYRRGCKMAVVACNTASAFSLDYLREHYGESFPIVGLVPALKPAVLQSQSKVVAVLATPATFRGQLIKDVIQNFAHPAGVKVLPVTSLQLVPFIEAGQQLSPACLNVLHQCLQPVIDQHADSLVLGCTHYPFLKEAITRLFGEKLTLIDSGLAVARQTARILIKNELLFDEIRQNHLQIECFVSGNNADELKFVLKHMISEHIIWRIQNIDR